MRSEKTLYIIPCPIAEEESNHSLAPQTIRIIHNTRHFITERAKTARRFIKSTIPPYAINEIEVEELDKHNNYSIPAIVYEWLEKGKSVGLLSEAGCPCIADPGFNVVRIARKYNYHIMPLVGPSSLILALMASGLNGQQFTFHGYLSNESGRLKNQIKQMEQQALKKNYSQLFIETPYRNEKLLKALLKILQPSTLLHISLNLTSNHQISMTHSISEWKNKIYSISVHKSPAVFIIGSE